MLSFSLVIQKKSFKKSRKTKSQEDGLKPWKPPEPDTFITME